jgi:hypothetical protein
VCVCVCVFSDYTLALAAAVVVQFCVRCVDAVAAVCSVFTADHASTVPSVVLVLFLQLSLLS